MHEERNDREQQPPQDGYAHAHTDDPQAQDADAQAQDAQAQDAQAQDGQAQDADGQAQDADAQAQAAGEHVPPLPGSGYEPPTMVYGDLPAMPPGAYPPPGAGGYSPGGYAPGEYGPGGYASGSYPPGSYGAGGYGPGGAPAGYGPGGHGPGGHGPGGHGAGGHDPGGTPGSYAPGDYGPGRYGPGSYPPPPPGYGPPGGYATGDIIGYGQPEQRPPRRGSRILTYVVVAALAAGIGAGTVLGLTDHGNSSNSGLPSAGHIPGPASGSSGGGTSASSSTIAAVAKAVSPGIVDVISTPSYQSGTLEGTGMVLNSNGLVLTNNHVVEGTSKVIAKIANTGQTFTATVLGTDQADDVALLKLNGASNLKTIPIGNSNTVQLGDTVVALGNAQGQDGAPTVVNGKITNLNQSIQASDQGAGTTENLHGMLQTNAPIVSGDSGGALANVQGKVIGMNTAANTSGLGGQGTSMGFAIPINRALAIARLIAAGQGSAKIQIGLPPFLGVTVATTCSTSAPSTAPSPQQQLQQMQCAAEQSNAFGGFGGGTGGSSGCLTANQVTVPARIAKVSSGTLVGGVLCNTPVNSAGMTSGSVITAINGQAVTAPASLTKTLSQFHPGDAVSVSWVAPNGQHHITTLKLAAGPAK